MRSTRSKAALGVACAGLLNHCAFDLTRLMPPPRDGDVPTDVAPMDAATDVAVDAGPPGPTCVSLLDPMNGRTIGGSLIITGNTGRAERTMDPAASCTTSSRGAPEVFFDYQMQRGGTLVAMTDVPTGGGADCPLRFDTIVSILSGSCEMPGMSLACDDDVGLDDPTTCYGSASRARATGLTANQSVSIVVDGFESTAGPFTLTLCENPLNEVRAQGMTDATACQCPASGIETATAEDVALVMASDMGAAAGGRLEAAGQYVGGPRTINGNTVKGIAGVIGIRNNDFNVRAECRMYSATFDVIVGGLPVRAFTVDSSTDTVRTPRLIFRTAPDVRFASPATVLVRMRSTSAPPMMRPCGIDLAAGTLTLLTARSTAMPPTDGGVRDR
jgi:hypothetical protein